MQVYTSAGNIQHVSIGPVSQKYRILRYEKTRVFYD